MRQYTARDLLAIIQSLPSLDVPIVIDTCCIEAKRHQVQTEFILTNHIKYATGLSEDDTVVALHLMGE